MCGIAGVLRLDGARVERSTLVAMAEAMARRGPDGAGYLQEGPVGLAHRRLRVIDTRSAADQPMRSADGRAAIVYNGEVFNFRELRRDLAGRGHRLRTGSDTEVVLAAYLEWGEACVERLDGMFAFAVWDGARRALVLARDPFGIKPLVYWWDGRALAFASEVSALLAAGAPRDLDPEGVVDFFSFQYVPHPGTVLAAVRKLPPAHVACLEDGRLRMRRYWEPPGLDPAPPPFGEAVEELGRRVDEAVGRALVADVPLGVFLSGGVDSAVVARAASLHAPGAGLAAFAAGFDRPDYDERRHAELAARVVGARLRTVTVGPPSAEGVADLVAGGGEPLGDSSVLASAEVARLARESVTVCLTGDGADEVLGGYDRHLREGCLSMASGGGPVRRLAAVARALAHGDRGGLRDLWRLAGLGPRARYLEANAYFDRGGRARLLAPELRRAAGGVGPYDPYERFAPFFDGGEPRSPLARALRLDLEFYLPGAVLAKADRSSMCHSLELRVPLLSRSVVDFALSLPDDYKLRRLERKAVLKRLAERTFPRSFVRRPKMGFTVPTKDWLRGPLLPMARGLLTDARARSREVYDARYAAELLDEHRRGVANHARRIWLCLVFECWMRRWIDSPVASVAGSPEPAPAVP
ncbi:MAG: asparagine synthase (glutamine-hydrolyzing) [Planctomycetes bacterium]|nr:asparagine synthase (glutamine-hydrolyzing) [Planctomycetota bacterium]